jgi:nucleoside-diphosphate-sugar epimerase
MRATTYSDLRRICVDGSNTLFEAARRAGVERIVFISTISAFDGCRSAYGKTKLAVEKSLAGTTAVVLRPGLVFGGSHSGGVFGSIRKQVPIPWQLLYFGIRVGELLKMNLPFRSDSVISFIYSDRNPDFAPMQSLGIAPVPYAPVPQ